MLFLFPLMILVLITYNVVVFFTGISLNAELFSVTMVSDAVWVFTVSDLILLFGLFLLFFEVLKATRTGPGISLDHLLSTLVFVAALIEFILIGKAATSTFFLIVVLCFVDMTAGFSVSISSARRDFSVGGGGHGPY